MASTSKPTLSAQWTKLAVLPPRNAVRNANGEMEVDGEDSDEWEEDEVSYVTLDLGTYLSAPAIQSEKNDIQLLGENSSTPYVKVRDVVLQGTWEETIGCEILLKGDEHDPASLVPLEKTSTHRIIFQPVQLTSRAKLAAAAEALAASKAATPAAAAEGPKKGGRPKGSKNKKASTAGKARAEPIASGSGAEGGERFIDAAVEPVPAATGSSSPPSTKKRLTKQPGTKSGTIRKKKSLLGRLTGGVGGEEVGERAGNSGSEVESNTDGGGEDGSGMDVDP